MRGCAQLVLVVGVGLAGAGVIPAKELVGIAEVPFSTDNPFFDHTAQKPYFEPLPDTLLQALGAADCKWAWKRQQHVTSTLDTACTEILRPWIEATPGALLGALDAITITEGFLINPHPYALLTKPDMLSWTGPRSAEVNLTKVGWKEAAPAIFAPQPLQSEQELHDDMVQGGKAPEAYVAHGFAAWAFKLAGGSATASDEDVFTAFKHAVELYTWMGHHAKQQDDSHRIYTDEWAGKTLIHGAHGASYAYYSIQMDRKYPSPSTDVEGMWADLKAVCGPAGEVDYSLYVSCAHGLGHALSFYVSGYRASAAEAVQVCAHAAPDGRVAASCGDGFFHEFERANIWYDDALGQNFMPYGVKAPCDDVALQPFIYGCMYHVFIPSTSERSPVGGAWVEKFQKDGLPMAKLNAEGARQWRALAGFCGKENYASSQQQASCAATFVSYFYTNLKAASIGHNWLAESLLLEPSLRRAGKADGLPHPRLTVSQSASGMPYYPASSEDGLKLALCEAITDSYWSWMICALDGVAVQLEFVHSLPYSTVPSSHKLDPYAYAYGEGEMLGAREEGQASATCVGVWADERFESGTEKQVAFMRNACVESVFSHGYMDWPLYEWSSLPSLYATFNSTTASALASKVAAGDHDAAKAAASQSKNMASADAIADSTSARPILLIHVEKTGGTSILETLGIESAGGNGAVSQTAECAGIPVQKSLHARHQTAAQAQPYYTEEQWADAYKIAFVRNPWDRLVSLWSFWMGSPANIDANRDEVLTACGCAYSDVGELARRVAARQPPSEPSNALQPEAPLDWWDLVTEDDYACNFSHFLAHCATLSKDYNLTQINSGLWFNVAKHSQREWVAGIASTGADPYDYSIVDFIGRTENATAHLSAALEAAGNSKATSDACAASMVHDTHGTTHGPYVEYYNTTELRAIAADVFQVDAVSFGYQLGEDGPGDVVLLRAPDTDADAAVVSHAPATPQRSVSESRQLQQAVSDAATDFGAEFAPTEPLLGTTIELTWADSVVVPLPKAACAALKASADRHIYYFDEAQDGQQPQERRFMERIPTELCVNPRQSEDAYMAILHSMLSDARAGIARHVHSAFWVKAAFAKFGDACYDATSIYAAYFAGAGAFEADSSDVFLAKTIPILEAVLRHEKYNLAEGWFFVNMTYSMLAQGAAFCRDAGLKAKVAVMTAGLEDRMAYHASSATFDYLVDSFKAQVCTQPDAGDAGEEWDAIYNETVQQIDAAVLGDAACTYGDNAAQRMTFLKHASPDADDLITIINGNTKVALAAAAYAVQQTMAPAAGSQGTCLDADTGAADAAAAARIAAKLAATGLPDAARNGTASTHIKWFAIPSVYHKLGITCVGNGEDLSDVCVTSADGKLSMVPGLVDPAEADNSPIFDLGTSTDVTKCSGNACKAAARAVLQYQALLTKVTTMRGDMLHVTMGASSGGFPAAVLDQTDWTFQRTCQAFENIVDRAQEIQAALPAVISALRAAAPQLDAQCIAPVRSALTSVANVAGL